MTLSHFDDSLVVPARLHRQSSSFLGTTLAFHPTVKNRPGVHKLRILFPGPGIYVLTFPYGSTYCLRSWLIIGISVGLIAIFFFLLEINIYVFFTSPFFFLHNVVYTCRKVLCQTLCIFTLKDPAMTYCNRRYFCKLFWSLKLFPAIIDPCFRPASSGLNCLYILRRVETKRHD